MPDERHYHHHHHHYGDRGGYAYRAGEPGPGPNLNRLRRNMRTGKVAGVCAGLADYFGWRVKYLRIGLVLATVFFFPMPLFAYAVAAVFMKPGGSTALPQASPEEERFWRTYSVRPKATFAELKHRFRAIEARVANMEQTVTSNEYGLRKQFRDLERGI